MQTCGCDPLALTTAVNTLAAALLTQLGDTLATIAVQRSLCSGETPSG